jgi:DNA-binding PadR family transcriptional regulator
MDFTSSKESLTLYKLIVLYMLDKVAFPLTQSQISEFILEKGYTNYLTLQQVLSELIETNLINAHSTAHRTQLTITGEGRDTLGFFEGRIGDAIKQDIHEYFRDKSLELRNEVSVVSNYYKTTNGDYEASLSARDRDSLLVEIKLSVPTPQLAASICDNWREKNQEVYQMLTRMLF